MKQEHAVISRNQTDTDLGGSDKNTSPGSATTIKKREECAARFVSKFTNHYQRCKSLAKRFAVDKPELQDSVALSQLCRASQEMLEQAKEARAVTEIYLALDDKHREAVRPIIIARFKDISKSADVSWRRFCDSIQFLPTDRLEIESAQRDFEPHAREFQETLHKFVALGDQATTTDGAD